MINSNHNNTFYLNHNHTNIRTVNTNHITRTSVTKIIITIITKQKADTSNKKQHKCTLLEIKIQLLNL